jgi:hypothetical protein
MSDNSDMPVEQTKALAAPVDVEMPLADVPKNATPSYDGISAQPVSKEAAAILMAPISDDDVEIRPDGIIYVPEIRYRRILHKAFGPGGWAIKPLQIMIDNNIVCYRGQLWVSGRFVAEAVGEQEYFPQNKGMTYASAVESARSNLMLRCCKDLGVASECWDPSFISRWKAANAIEVWCDNAGDRGPKCKPMWRKKTAPPINQYPWTERGQKKDKQVPTGGEHQGDTRPQAVASPPLPPAPPAAPASVKTVESKVVETKKKYRDYKADDALIDKLAGLCKSLKMSNDQANSWMLENNSVTLKAATNAHLQSLIDLCEKTIEEEKNGSGPF